MLNSFNAAGDIIKTSTDQRICNASPPPPMIPIFENTLSPPVEGMTSHPDFGSFKKKIFIALTLS